jgi:hypothetical protein
VYTLGDRRRLRTPPYRRERTPPRESTNWRSRARSPPRTRSPPRRFSPRGDDDRRIRPRSPRREDRYVRELEISPYGSTPANFTDTSIGDDPGHRTTAIESHVPDHHFRSEGQDHHRLAHEALGVHVQEALVEMTACNLQRTFRTGDADHLLRLFGNLSDRLVEPPRIHLVGPHLTSIRVVWHSHKVPLEILEPVPRLVLAHHRCRFHTESGSLLSLLPGSTPLHDMWLPIRLRKGLLDLEHPVEYPAISLHNLAPRPYPPPVGPLPRQTIVGPRTLVLLLAREDMSPLPAAHTPEEVAEGLLAAIDKAALILRHGVQHPQIAQLWIPQEEVLL